MVCQAVIDIAGELSVRQGVPFDDYVGAVRNLRQRPEFSEVVVTALEKLPGFRNVLIHEYVGFDLDRAAQALRELETVEEFVRVASRMES
jgi:uncharacterized protein YutE (UPF0331/DUF86 family)